MKCDKTTFLVHAVRQDRRKRTVSFKLLDSDLMSSFEGMWCLYPYNQRSVDTLFGKTHRFNPLGGLRGAHVPAAVSLRCIIVTPFASTGALQASPLRLLFMHNLLHGMLSAVQVLARGASNAHVSQPCGSVQYPQQKSPTLCCQCRHHGDQA